MFDYRDYHRTVVAFHGTTSSVADRLVNGGDFTPSSKTEELRLCSVQLDLHAVRFSPNANRNLPGSLRSHGQGQTDMVRELDL